MKTTDLTQWEGCIVKILWKFVPDGGWPYFMLIEWNGKDGRLLMEQVDYPNGSQTRHTPGEFWHNICSIDEIDVVQVIYTNPNDAYDRAMGVL